MMLTEKLYGDADFKRRNVSQLIAQQYKVALSSGRTTVKVRTFFMIVGPCVLKKTRSVSERVAIGLLPMLHRRRGGRDALWW